MTVLKDLYEKEVTNSLTRTFFFLSPQFCPEESDTGYMLMEGASPPERIYEYDYTEPLQPDTLFRISHGDTEQVIVQVSIGDLSDVALSEHQLQQQQRQPYDQVITSLANTDENYEDIENLNVKNGLPTEGKNVGHCGSQYKSQSAGSYENLSRENEGHLSGRRTDPEEYVEMGKRKSALVSDYTDQSGCSGFPNIDEEGPEYHVLEELETSESKSFELICFYLGCQRKRLQACSHRSSIFVISFNAFEKWRKTLELLTRLPQLCQFK